MQEENIMKFQETLPENFDGTFRFTNWTEEDFVGVWNKREYHFPAKSTSPMIMPEFTPLEVQHIRKKFAKALAEREFFKSQNYARLMGQERNPDGSPRLNSIQQAGTYDLGQLSNLIQRCLEPLEIKQASVTDAPVQSIEDRLSRNEDGELNTQAIDKKTSLKEKALKS